MEKTYLHNREFLVSGKMEYLHRQTDFPALWGELQQ